jgi:hypothetical protein
MYFYSCFYVDFVGLVSAFTLLLFFVEFLLSTTITTTTILLFCYSITGF